MEEIVMGGHGCVRDLCVLVGMSVANTYFTHKDIHKYK